MQEVTDQDGIVRHKGKVGIVEIEGDDRLAVAELGDTREDYGTALVGEQGGEAAVEAALDVALDVDVLGIQTLHEGLGGGGGGCGGGEQLGLVESHLTLHGIARALHTARHVDHPDSTVCGEGHIHGDNGIENVEAVARTPVVLLGGHDLDGGIQLALEHRLQEEGTVADQEGIIGILALDVVDEIDIVQGQSVGLGDLHLDGGEGFGVGFQGKDGGSIGFYRDLLGGCGELGAVQIEVQSQLPAALKGSNLPRHGDGMTQMGIADVRKAVVLHGLGDIDYLDIGGGLVFAVGN